MLPQTLCVEKELQKDVHLDGVLRKDQPPVVFGSQLLQTEKGQVTEYLVQHTIITVSAGGMPLKEYSVENLNE